MAIDWISVCLAFVTILVFLAIFTLLRTMSSPYIARFAVLLRSKMVPISGVEDAYRISFVQNNRDFELIEVKYETREARNKVYDSYIFLGLKTKTDFTLHLDDLLNKISVAGILEKTLGTSLDYNCYPLDSKEFPELYRDFRIMANNLPKVKGFLNNPEVIEILKTLKTQFSAYGFLMPIVINRGDIIVDYGLSRKLLDELVYNPRNIFEHTQLLHRLAACLEKL